MHDIFLTTLEQLMIFSCIFTACIRRMARVLFSQVCVCPGGYPSPRFFPRDTPIPGSFPGLWSQVLSLGVLQSQLGAYSRTGVSPLVERTGLGYPPCQDRTGECPLPGQDSRVSTCYVAGSMPLAVTQENFLVVTDFHFMSTIIIKCVQDRIPTRKKGNFLFISFLYHDVPIISHF